MENNRQTRLHELSSSAFMPLRAEAANHWEVFSTWRPERDDTAPLLHAHEEANLNTPCKHMGPM